MIPGIFNIIVKVLISIDTFLIYDNIENGKNTCRNKRKDYNLAIGQQETINKSARVAVTQRTFIILFAINNIYKPIKSIYF